MIERKIITVLLLLTYFSNVFSKPSVFDLVADESHVYEQGGGKSYEGAQQSARGEKGELGYSGRHDEEKGRSGHHDRENHKKEYAEEGGHKKSQNHNDGYYGGGYKEAHGEKGYHYVDNGSYAKGHSTKGQHNIQKLDEFKKEKEFFDEDHDEAHKEKHGAYEVSKAAKNGAAQFGGHANNVHFAADYGLAGKAEKGAHNSEDAGYLKAKGHDQLFKDAEEFAKKGSAAFFKHFGYIEKDRD